MEERNLQIKRDNEKSRAKTVWFHVALAVGAIALAILTVFVINLNR